MDSIEFISKDIGILIVDDQIATRDLIKAILRGTGFTNVAQAENGMMALDLLNKNQFNLIVCDWNMPEMNGLELLKKVRSDSRFSKIPFIMLTAEAYQESVRAALEAGVTDYIAKPFTAEILLKKISSVFVDK